MWLRFKPKQAEKCCEREKIKIIPPFHSYPWRDRKFQKNGKKIQNIKIVTENSIKIGKKI